MVLENSSTSHHLNPQHLSRLKWPYPQHLSRLGRPYPQHLSRTFYCPQYRPRKATPIHSPDRGQADPIHSTSRGLSISLVSNLPTFHHLSTAHLKLFSHLRLPRQPLHLLSSFPPFLFIFFGSGFGISGLCSSRASWILRPHLLRWHLASFFDFFLGNVCN